MHEMMHAFGEALREVGHAIHRSHKPGHHVDPTLIPCAAGLMVDVMADVDSQALRHGVALPVARARAIEARADAWVREVGRECADMAVRGLHMVEPEAMLSQATRAAVRRRAIEERGAAAASAAQAAARWRAEHRAVLLRCAPHLAAELYPEPRRWPRRAVAAVALLLVLLGLTWAVSRPAWAADADQLVPCATARGREADVRRCWRYSTTERETHRAYDGKRGDPDPWERPRAWE